MSKEIRLALAGDTKGVPPPLLHSIAAENVRFEAICDADGLVAETAARTYGARWPFDDLEQMLGEAEPDAVIIAAPAEIRPDWTKTCLKHRTAVLVLGAPGTNHAECRSVAKLARRVNRQVMIGLPQRFSPAAVRARRLLESGKIGRVASVDVTMTWPRDPGRHDPSDLPLPFDLAFDAADRLRWCNVEPERIWAVARPYGHVAAMVLASDGVVATLGLHYAGTPKSAGSHIEVRSEDGGVLLISDDVNMTCTVGSQLVHQHTPRLGAGDDPRIECGHAGMVAEFVAALRDQQGVPFGLPSATRSVLLAAAVFQAARSGRPVKYRSPR